MDLKLKCIQFMKNIYNISRFQNISQKKSVTNESLHFQNLKFYKLFFDCIHFSNEWN